MFYIRFVEANKVCLRDIANSFVRQHARSGVDNDTRMRHVQRKHVPSVHVAMVYFYVPGGPVALRHDY